MKTNALIVYVTAAHRKEADKIARVLVEERKAACVTIIPEVHSRYWWKSRVSEDRELLLMIKTSSARYKALEKRVKELHSYKVPEILAIPVIEGSADYLKWLKKSVR